MNPHAPPDLSELCVGLLSNRPEERRHAAATIPAAPANAPGAAGDPSIRRVADVEHFVGRSTQLHQIDAAFADTQEGRLNVVIVNGPSGIGKTTLVKRFLSSLEQRQPDAIVLRGRCYEFESVPYRGWIRSSTSSVGICSGCPMHAWRHCFRATPPCCRNCFRSSGG